MSCPAPPPRRHKTPRSTGTQPTPFHPNKTRVHRAGLWPRLCLVCTDRCLQLLSFAASPSRITSDHKPVAARFALSAPRSEHERIDEYASHASPSAA
eukprot:COSAG01_NODE_1550_length_9943_cov_233.259651_14_plen_97_part_00